MIFLDTETTGLIKATAPLELQPRIIEIAAIKWPHSLSSHLPQQLHSLVNAGVPLPEVITKITKLTDADLADAPSFASILPSIVEFFRGEHTVVAHNVEFDMQMLINELRLMDWQFRFPYPSTWIDTVALSGGKKLDVWSKELLGEDYTAQSHRAMGDAERLLACWKKHHEQ